MLILILIPGGSVHLQAVPFPLDCSLEYTIRNFGFPCENIKSKGWLRVEFRICHKPSLFSKICLELAIELLCMHPIGLHRCATAWKYLEYGVDIGY